VGKGDQSGTKKRAMHIKRFDPSNPSSHALLIKKEEVEESKQNQKKMEEGRQMLQAKKKEA